DRTELAARLAAADADDAELRRLRAERSRLQRDARRHGTDATAALARTDAALSDVEARLAAIAPYRTSAHIEFLGYTSPTPFSDGTRLYALAGHGVLAAFSLEGE